MAAPELELDPKHFEVISTTETVALIKHRVTGSFAIFRLEWCDRADFPNGMEAEAWAKFMDYLQR